MPPTSARTGSENTSKSNRNASYSGFLARLQFSIPADREPCLLAGRRRRSRCWRRWSRQELTNGRARTRGVRRFPDILNFFLVVRRQMPGKGRILGWILEDGVFDFDVASRAKTAEQIPFLLVARQLANVAHIHHGGDRRVGLERPAPRVQLRRLGGGRRSANFNDKNATDR